MRVRKINGSFDGGLGSEGAFRPRKNASGRKIWLCLEFSAKSKRSSR
jgi:hypothetical protein